MKYFILLFLISLFSCQSPVQNTLKISLEFETVNHYPYELIQSQFKVLKTQEEIDSLFSIIHSKSIGNRFAPIPTATEEETFVVFKTKLKNTNDVEIKNVYTENKILYIDLQEVENPQIAKSSRISPNILIKLLKKVSVEKLIINAIK